MDNARVTELGEGGTTVHQNTQSPEVIVAYAALRHSVNVADLMDALCAVLDDVADTHNLGLRQLAIAVLHAVVAGAEENAIVTRFQNGQWPECTVVFQMGSTTLRECPKCPTPLSRSLALVGPRSRSRSRTFFFGDSNLIDITTLSVYTK